VERAYFAIKLMNIIYITKNPAYIAIVSMIQGIIRLPITGYRAGIEESAPLSA
jgi:hypothetical protein